MTSKLDRYLQTLTYKQAVYQLLAALERVAMSEPSGEVRRTIADMLQELEIKLRMQK